MATLNKLIDLDLLNEFSKTAQKKIPSMTLLEYEQKKDTISAGTVFIITDDAVAYSSIATQQVTQADIDDIFNDVNTSPSTPSDDNEATEEDLNTIF